MPRNPFSTRAPQERKIQWTKDSVERLASILGRTPRPNNAAVAEEMGVSAGSVQTAISRFNLSTPREENPDLSGENYQKPLRNQQRRIRPCINCRRPFASEGFHNRLCNSCNTSNEEIAYGA